MASTILTRFRPRRPYNRRKKARTKKKVKRGTKVTPMKRLRGVTGMPYFKYERCFDSTPKLLSTATHQAAGFWCDSLHTEVNQIPGAVSLCAMYRFYRIKKVLIQYTPSVRSDEYAKIFYVPTGLTPLQPYLAKGGSLEIKQLAYDGFLPHPTTWASCLNRAGKLQKAATTRSFIRQCYPRINQIIQDLSGTDTQRSIKAPWLSTDNASNLTIPHFIGYDCYHTLNDISYDVDQPLRVSRRFVVTLEFKGLKI